MNDVSPSSGSGSKEPPRDASAETFSGERTRPPLLGDLQQDSILDKPRTIYTERSVGGTSEVGSGYAYRRPPAERKSSDSPSGPKAAGETKSLSSDGGKAILAILLFMLLLLIISGFCQRDYSVGEKPVFVSYDERKIEQSRFFGLEATRKARDETLVAEVARLIDESALPADLYQTKLDEKHNVAVQLRKHFEAFEDNRRDLQRLAVEQPLGAWTISPETLKSVAPVLDRLRPQRELIRQVLDREKVEFGLDLVETKTTRMLNPKVPDLLRDYILLEEFAVARALAEGDMNVANDSLRYIFKLARLASFAKSMPLRFTAAEIRQKALNILQTLVLDSRFSPEDKGLFLEELRHTLANWPDDALAWVGERAYGMQMFESIRQDGILPPLPSDTPSKDYQTMKREMNQTPTPPTTEEMLKRVELSAFTYNELAYLADPVGDPGFLLWVNDGLFQTIDADEVFYLRTMRSIITASSEPYYRQVHVFDTLVSDIYSKRDQPDEPFIASILLRDVRAMAQTQAVDRAQVEAFAVALTLSDEETGRAPWAKPLVNAINPLTGEGYSVQRSERHVSTAYFPGGPRFLVPRTNE